MPKTSTYAKSFVRSRSLLLEELARIDDEAHCIIRGLVELGVPKAGSTFLTAHVPDCIRSYAFQVLEEPDPSTICSEYDSGLLRRMQMEDAWGFKEPRGRVLLVFRGE